MTRMVTATLPETIEALKASFELFNSELFSVPEDSNVPEIHAALDAASQLPVFLNVLHRNAAQLSGCGLDLPLLECQRGIDFATPHLKQLAAFNENDPVALEVQRFLERLPLYRTTVELVLFLTSSKPLPSDAIDRDACTARTTIKSLKKDYADASDSLGSVYRSRDLINGSLEACYRISVKATFAVLELGLAYAERFGGEGLEQASKVTYNIGQCKDAVLNGLSASVMLHLSVRPRFCAKPLLGRSWRRRQSFPKSSSILIQSTCKLDNVLDFIMDPFLALQSDIFEFEVGRGEQKRTARIHKDIAAALSDNIKALCTAPFKEGLQNKAVIEDVDYETFCRVSQFAYVYNYTEASPSVAEGKSQMDPASLKNDERTFFSRQTPYTMQAQPFARFHMKSSGQAFNGIVLKAAPTLPSFNIRLNKNEQEDYTEVLLSHAKVYVFALKWQIEGLQSLSLRKTYDTLDHFTLYPARTGDVVALAAFIYSVDEDDTPLVPEPDEMRNIVVKYIARESRPFLACKAFQDLIERGGPCASDLWRAMSGEMNALRREFTPRAHSHQAKADGMSSGPELGSQ